MTVGTKITTTIRRTGPFFEKDPRKTFRQNVRTMMDAVAREGEDDVVAQMKAGDESRAPIAVGGGRVSGHVVGRTHSLSGRRWAVTAVVSVNAAGHSKVVAQSQMAAASRVEKVTRAFRRTTGRLRKARAINVAELLKGLT